MQFIDKYITESNLASEFEIHVRTLRRWHAERTGPPRIKIGKKVLYNIDSVCEWIKQNEFQMPQDSTGKS